MELVNIKTNRIAKWHWYEPTNVALRPKSPSAEL